MFARTKRLTLRPGWSEDAPALSRAIAHESVIRMLALAPWPYALGDAEAFLALPRDSDTPEFLIDVMEHGTPRLVGGIGIRATGGAHEFGYWLTPDVWGRGYATEAGEAVIAIARHSLGLRRLEAAPFVDNPASGRVLTKLGFRHTGRVETRRSRGRTGEAAAALYALDLDDDRCEPVPMAA